MALVAKDSNGKESVVDDTREEGEESSLAGRKEREDSAPKGREVQGSGEARGGDKDTPSFFHIYKKGRGYKTRMGTVFALAIMVAGFVGFLYDNMRIWIQDSNKNPKTGEIVVILGALLAVMILGIFQVLNRPKIVDFMIATDDEMKKVNWTTRAELIGSTKVVIFFMFFVAIVLFAIDIAFGYFFYFIHVLDNKPF